MLGVTWAWLSGKILGSGSPFPYRSLFCVYSVSSLPALLGVMRFKAQLQGVDQSESCRVWGLTYSISSAVCSWADS